MRRLIGIFCFGAGAALLIAAAAPNFTRQTRPLLIDNTRDEVKLRLQGPVGTTNLIEAYAGSNLRFALPSTGIVPPLYGGTGAALGGIRAGVSGQTVSGAVTVVFGVNFPTAPVVVFTQNGGTGEVARVVSKTESNAVLFCGEDSVTLNWIAIGL